MNEMANYLPGLFLAFTALFFGIISPGPSVLAILGMALGSGRRSAVAMASGVGLGSTLWATITVAGLSALIAVSAKALIIIKLFGGCYLIWLGINAARNALRERKMEVEKAVKSSVPSAFAQGVAIHMTNPKAAMVWLSIAALAIKPGAPLWVSLTLIGGTFMLSCSLNILYALLFTSEPVFAAYKSVRRGVQGALAGFFIFAGGTLLASLLRRAA